MFLTKKKGHVSTTEGIPIYVNKMFSISSSHEASSPFTNFLIELLKNYVVHLILHYYVRSYRIYEQYS